MTGDLPPCIFISYSRKDGAGAAAKLRTELAAQGFAIWQDLVALESGRDWWSQIEAALKSKALQHFVLIVTPGALTSPVVRREIRLARQEGKTFLPVRGPGLSDLSTLPRLIGQLTDLYIPEHRATLLHILGGPSKASRVPMMAPEPPADFVPRPTEFEALKRQLLTPETKDAVAITAALRGAGGYGKTTLARALAHDPDIHDAYFDGILWVELGEQGGARVLSIIADLVSLIDGQPRAMATREAARTALAEALGDRRILLIIDDVWKRTDLDAFLHGGRHTTRLITTRFDKELPETAVRQLVDAMRTDEARALLSGGLSAEQARAHGAELDALARKLHDWAQLLKLANGFLRDRVLKFRQPLGAAIVEAEKRLAARGMPAFDDPKAREYEGRHKSVAAAIGLNLDLLDARQRDLFGLLGVFPEDADVPVSIVARMWAEDGEVDEFATLDVLVEFYDLSLLLDLDMDRRTIRFHDTTRHYLQDEARKRGALAAQHQRLAEAMADLGRDNPTFAGSGAPPSAEAVYYYRYLPTHLAGAGAREQLDALLLDPGWLEAKLAATDSPQTLVADYEQFGEGEVQLLIGNTLRLITGICARHTGQLLPQLHGRLMACRKPAASVFLSSTMRLLKPPTIITRRPSLTPPGAETARLEGHSGSVWALAVLKDGRLASGSYDNTIRLWNPASGAETARLEGHSDWVTALAALADGRLASGSADNSIRLWDMASGAETARLEGHSGRVRALAALVDGRLASASDDHSVRLWDLSSGAETARLEGHSARVRALAALTDGRLASGSLDNTIRLWDLSIGAETARLEGHSGEVRALVTLADGRLASASSDNSIRLWDLSSGAETARLEGHRDEVRSLTLLPNGRLASGSSDNTIRLWDLSSGVETARLGGHGDWVRALAVLPDGRLASGSSDNTIRLWNLSSAADTVHPEGHSGGIRALLRLTDAGLASGADDRSIRLWDLSSGVETARLEGHRAAIKALALLPDGRLASGSSDNTIRLWDLSIGAETARLEGHSDAVRALTLVPDGRLASGSSDSGIRLWDLLSDAETARLEGHDDQVRALVMLRDGRLASGSDDRTIRLWDLSTGVETARLEGHDDKVRALVMLPDGRLASGSDDRTIRLWDLSIGVETARLEGHDDWVRALAVLPGGRLASGSQDRTIRVWDLSRSREIMLLEVDAAVLRLVALSSERLVAGDSLGRLHWLEVIA